MCLIDVAVLGVLLILAGLVMLSTPEWIRSLYVKQQKNRKAAPLKRAAWQKKEQTMGAAFVAAGIVILVLRIVSGGIIVDVIAALIVFGMVLWRTFSFMGA